MQIRHDRVHEKGLEPIDALYVHLVCDHGCHPHNVDQLDLEAMNDQHRIEHEVHEIDLDLRRRITNLLSAWDDGDQLRLANVLSGLRSHVGHNTPQRRGPQRPRLVHDAADTQP